MSMLIGELAKAGQVYTGATVAATVTTGLIWNPFNSGKYLVMYDAAAAMSIAPAQSEVMLSVSGAVSQTAPTGTTQNATIQNAKVGTTGTNGGAVAQVWTGTTLPAVNVNYKVVPGSNLSASMVTGVTFYSKLDGSLIVVPGTGVMFSFTTAAYTAQMSMTWAEVVILPGGGF